MVDYHCHPELSGGLSANVFPEKPSLKKISGKMHTLKLKSLKIFQLFTIYLRYLIGFAWVFASIVKIEGNRFTAFDGTDAPINSTGHMFETLYQSGIFWQFIGWAQLITGGLLLSQRFSLLGSVMGLPMASNIFVITISYSFGGTPYITGLMLLGNIFLLVWDWDKLKVLLEPETFRYTPPGYSMMYDKTWTFLGIFYFLATIILRKFFFEGKGIVLGALFFILIGLGMMIYNWRRYSTRENLHHT